MSNLKTVKPYGVIGPAKYRPVKKPDNYTGTERWYTEKWFDILADYYEVANRRNERMHKELNAFANIQAPKRKTIERLSAYISKSSLPNEIRVNMLNHINCILNKGQFPKFADGFRFMFSKHKYSVSAASCLLGSIKQAINY
jgi:transcription initiation factor TFIIIB Brf1 subunit/transcription initiation factor TFIIB